MKAEASASPDYSSIGVCLSGGGFRASFYALGLLRYLAEADLLNRVVAISAVSGGSIAAAAAGDRWADYQEAGGDLEAFLDKIDRPFRDTVTKRNIRRRWMFGSIVALIPFTGGRGAAYARTLAHNLFEHKRVADLPQHPEIIFTSTDLSKGRAFRVASAYIGSWDYKYIEPTPSSVKLGKAVAASAAFPPSMTVVNLATDGLQFSNPPPNPLSLVDGGVYDNVGLEWFQGWGEDAERPAAAAQPTFTIVANASGLLAVRNKRFRPIKALTRDLAIQYLQSVSVRTRWYRDALVRAPGTGVYMAIKTDPRDQEGGDGEGAALPSELVKPLALLRTDLDRFSQEEANLLSYHAYWTLHARLKEFAPSLTIATPAWRDFADLPADDTERLRKTLMVGSHRFFRRVRRRLPWGWDA